jgi:cytochrome c heme-lyase
VEEGTTWTYPSPQQFLNALQRKGKVSSGEEEGAVESVVALHNNMNEKTWRKILQWEEAMTSSEKEPKLLRFQGRPTDLSPKAAFKHYVLGHPLPFDRHDWVVQRADGKLVRYVMDYYHDESRASDDASTATPALHDADATPSLLVDVRPALDRPSALFHRLVTMPIARRGPRNSEFEPLPMRPTETMRSQVSESVEVWKSIQQQAAGRQSPDEATVPDISEAQAKELARNFATVRTECQKAQAAVDQCSTEEECARAALDLTMCMGQRVCPLQHEALVNVLAADDDATIEEALGRLNDCVALKTQQHAVAKEKFPKLF